MKKICPTCKNEFEKDFESQRYCKPCKRIYDNNYHKKTKERRNSRKRVTKPARGLSYRARAFTYLQSHPCIDCGESDPMVLQFDHREDSIKEFNIGQSWQRKGWNTILREIEKCDVRCANCHQRITKMRDKGQYKPEANVMIYDPSDIMGLPDNVSNKMIVWLK